MVEQKANSIDTFLKHLQGEASFTFDDEVLAAVPLLGMAMQLCSGSKDVRSRAFIAKLSTFLSDPAMQHPTTKERLRSGLGISTNDAQRIERTLFMALERMTDLDKPTLLAKVFVSFIHGGVSGEDMRRLANAMDLAFTDDLLSLLGLSEDAPTSNSGDWQQQLVRAGLTRVVAGESLAAITTYAPMLGGSLSYEITKLGCLFKLAVEHGDSLCTSTNRAEATAVAET